MKSMLGLGLGLAMLTLGSLGYVVKNDTYEVAPVVAVPIVREQVSDSVEIPDDTDILAEVCMGEAGNQPMIGKVAVIVTVLNRSRMNNMTVEEVVTQKGQYNGYPYKGIISNECYEAVEIARQAVDLGIFPENMVYFRAGKYHSFGTPYVPIGDHYFSLQPVDSSDEKSTVRPEIELER